MWWLLGKGPACSAAGQCRRSLQHSSLPDSYPSAHLNRAAERLREATNQSNSGYKSPQCYWLLLQSALTLHLADKPRRTQKQNRSRRQSFQQEILLHSPEASPPPTWSEHNRSELPKRLREGEAVRQRLQRTAGRRHRQ